MCVIYFITKPKESNMRAYNAVSKLYEEIIFGYTTNKEALVREGGE